MGFSTVLLNFALISGQVQQAALYTGLFLETISSGKTYKLYETCTMDYNNQKCMVASTSCPKNQALLIDSRCTTNITFKYNTLTMNTGSVAKDLPHVFPLYQFLFRGILGEADNMMVLSQHATGIFTYAAIWLFLMLVTTKAGTKIIKWTAILANTSLLAYIFTYTMIWLFFERPFTFDIQQLAELDTNFNKTTLTEDASWWMWFDVAIHIMTHMGLGDGGMIAIASNQSFTSSILIDAVLIGIVWGLVPYVWASCTQPLAINQIYQMVKRSQGYTHGNSTFIRGYHGYIRKAAYHTNMFSLALGLMAFKNFGDGLLGIFCVAGFFLVMTNVVIRFEIILSCLSEQIVGLKKVTYACRVRAVVVLGLLTLLFTTHRHGLHLLNAFYSYSLITVTSFIIIMEVLICFIYSPRRIFADINATEIAWSWVSRSRRFHQCLEVLSLFAIASWLLVPVVLIGVVIIHYAKLEEDMELQSFSHKLMGFLMSVFVLVPIFLIFFKRMYMVVKSKTKLSLEFKPNRHLWGPRRANDRALAQHVEREYRVHF
ncbi:unnamed protein product, partial [Mesorhabditis belari]|uniref:Uncharacterized protein n=1 Tax=Mesorhabditis belari TaxID=2138241 RepID=A0AAF3ESC0_9BILA